MTVTSRPGSSLPPVPHRGRPTEYTPEEDTIILTYRGTDEVNDHLQAAGFQPRTQAAIWSRRKQLKDGAQTLLNVEDLAINQEAAMLFGRRRKLQERRAALVRQLAETETDIEAITERLRELVEDPGPAAEQPF